MPRTAFWAAFVRAVSENPRFVEDPQRADVLFPAEDVARETNWPRYGDPERAYVRGRADDDRHGAYLGRLAAVRRPLCIVNMMPFMRLPRLFQPLGNVIVADICLSAAERAANPRTVSMPALPITVGAAGAGARRILASFRGAMSHPCRESLWRAQDGERFVCEVVEPANHVRRIDAQARSFDSAYVDLMANSEFAYVPRGDALFSYRLLEAISFGCIPVVLADGWVLPFDRAIDWSAVALHPPEASAGALNRTLAEFAPETIAAMRAELARVWAERLGGLDAIVETLLREIEAIRGG